MAVRLEAGRSIPIGEREHLATPGRRTLMLRVLLGLALVASFAVAYGVSRGADEQVPPLLSPGAESMLVLDLSASVSDFSRIASTLRRLSREGEPTGLVVFSGGAYGLLPAGSPANELASLIRFYTPLRRSREVYPRNPWDAAEFRGGTSIASGLEVARYALLSAGAQRGTILLMSDLDSAGDSQRVSEAVVLLRQSGFELKIVPLDARPEDIAFFERIVGQTAFLAKAEREASIATPTERRFGGILPWSFLLVSGLIVVLLATNERLLARLEVRA